MWHMLKYTDVTNVMGWQYKKVIVGGSTLNGRHGNDQMYINCALASSDQCKQWLNCLWQGSIYYSVRWSMLVGAKRIHIKRVSTFVMTWETTQRSSNWPQFLINRYFFWCKVMLCLGLIHKIDASVTFIFD